MRKLSIIYLWVYTIFLVLGVLVGITSTILQFVDGDIAEGFSDLLITFVSGWVLFATVGVKAHEKECEQNDRK